MLPLDTTQKVIFETLINSAALQTTLKQNDSDGMIDNKIFDNVPDEKPYPFITMGDIQWADRSNQTWDGAAAVVTIRVHSRNDGGRGRLEVQSIQKIIDDLFNAKDICIEDWNIVSLRRVNVNILTSPDNLTYDGVQQFNLMIAEV